MNDYERGRQEVMEVVRTVSADRDEWKLQHENLLAIRQQELQQLSAALAENERLNEQCASEHEGQLDAMALVLNHEGHIEKLNKQLRSLQEGISTLRQQMESAEPVAEINATSFRWLVDTIHVSGKLYTSPQLPQQEPVNAELLAALKDIRDLDYKRSAVNMASFQANCIATQAILRAEQGEKK